jgi:uncharacterized protein YecE (DUF72 family)
MRGAIRIGVAGWTIGRDHAVSFPGDGTHLQRYARRFAAVELNSSFYRPHRPATYARWAESVPPDFRFAVKMPREITHRRKLIEVAAPLEAFLAEIRLLGDRLGPVLVQLPPKLAYNEITAPAFFAALRRGFDGWVVCEPRHPSWFSDTVDNVLGRYRVARVAADPAVVPRAALPGGWADLVYHRLHGSPRIYYSPYEPDHLDAIAAMIESEVKTGHESWCIFDNTARQAATTDALSLMERLARREK